MSGELSITTKFKIIFVQTVLNIRVFSILGVCVFLSIVFQCFSGIMLAFSLTNDSMLVCTSRSTEDMDDLYTDDFFWLHERGVDIIFLFLYFHFFRKIYQRGYVLESESAWKSGSFLFLIVHGVIFTGLVLCCTHLSDITLKIAANILNTLVNKMCNIGYWIFTDETLNTDTLARIMYLHYILPFLALFLSLDHMVDMHYNHRDTNKLSSRRVMYNWYYEILKKEFYTYMQLLLVIMIMGLKLFEENESLSYEYFM